MALRLIDSLLFSMAEESKSSASNEPKLISDYCIPKDNKINDGSTVHTVYNFINNEYFAPSSGQYFENKNPASNKVISRIARSNAEDINYAVSAAKKAFKSWSRLSADMRSTYLRKLSDCIKTRLNEFAKLESRDNGKPLSLAKAVDIPRAVKNFEFFASQLICDQTACHQMSDAINYSHRSPLGVCGLITPWNLPLYLLSWKIAPAIACGNTVVCKPSELTPMTAYLLTDCIKESGFPKGVINIVQGYGKECGEPLVAHADVKGISFTGGTLTGSRISIVAAPSFKKVSLELGGKNATIIFDDIDADNLDSTVAGAVRAGFANQGQICLCGSRLFVQSGIYDKFMNKFVEETKKMYSDKIGDPLTSGYGTVISLEHREKIEKYVDLAQKEGGKILLGGKRPVFDGKDKHLNDGAFYLPTIIAGLSPFKSKCATEEIFGPVVTVHSFESESEVIEMANCTEYGLAASVWAKDVTKAHRVAQNIETGMVWINCWLHRDLRVPFGGVKSSGVGRDGGLHSMDFWTETKNICVKIPQLPFKK